MKSNSWLKKEKEILETEEKKYGAINLKPCPFCGGEAYYSLIYLDGEPPQRSIKCRQCGFIAFLPNNNSNTRLSLTWNVRDVSLEDKILDICTSYFLGLQHNKYRDDYKIEQLDNINRIAYNYGINDAKSMTQERCFGYENNTFGACLAPKYRWS